MIWKSDGIYCLDNQKTFVYNLLSYMAKQVEAPISPEQLKDASMNYLRCLKLKPSSQVLIITDQMPTTGDTDPHLMIRRELASMLESDIERYHPIPVAKLEFGEKPTFEELHEQTIRALKELDALGGKTTTNIVYLGHDWKDRSGIYQAADEFGEDHTVKFAGSLGFTTGDCRVMSQIGQTQLEKITRSSEYFEDFFKEKPRGSFKITTRDMSGQEHQLDIDYDTSKAPFVSELGNFDGAHESALGEFENVKYINIPGGESFGTPFPFKRSNGTFSAEGITFTVRDGLLIHLDIDKNADMNRLSTAQLELIERTRAAETAGNEMSGKYLAISELGLGFYELAGIKTYPDSSTLTYEKSGPHIAFGHVAEKTLEQDEITGLAGSFRHADFVLDSPVLTWGQTKDSDQAPFYPPEK